MKFKETTEVVEFVAGLTRDIAKAREDGKISFFEAAKIVLGNMEEGLDAFDGIEKVLAELATARPEEIDAAYAVWLEKTDWNSDPRTGTRDIFNESILTGRQFLKLYRLIENTIRPPKAQVVPDPLADPL